MKKMISTILLGTIFFTATTGQASDKEALANEWGGFNFAAGTLENIIETMVGGFTWATAHEDSYGSFEYQEAHQELITQSEELKKAQSVLTKEQRSVQLQNLSKEISDLEKDQAKYDLEKSQQMKEKANVEKELRKLTGETKGNIEVKPTTDVVNMSDYYSELIADKKAEIKSLLSQKNLLSNAEKATIVQTLEGRVAIAKNNLLSKGFLRVVKTAAGPIIILDALGRLVYAIEGSNRQDLVRVNWYYMIPGGGYAGLLFH